MFFIIIFIFIQSFESIKNQQISNLFVYRENTFIPLHSLHNLFIIPLLSDDSLLEDKKKELY